MSFISYKQIKLKIILALLQQLMTPKHELYMTIPSSTRWYYLAHVFPLHAKPYFIQRWFHFCYTVLQEIKCNNVLFLIVAILYRAQYNCTLHACFKICHSKVSQNPTLVYVHYWTETKYDSINKRLWSIFTVLEGFHQAVKYTKELHTAHLPYSTSYMLNMLKHHKGTEWQETPSQPFNFLHQFYAIMFYGRLFCEEWRWVLIAAWFYKTEYHSKLKGMQVQLHRNISNTK